MSMIRPIGQSGTIRHCDVMERQKPGAVARRIALRSGAWAASQRGACSNRCAIDDLERSRDPLGWTVTRSTGCKTADMAQRRPNADKPHYVKLDICRIALLPNGSRLPRKAEECHHRSLDFNDLFRSQSTDSRVDVRSPDRCELVDHHVTVAVESG